MKIKIEKDIRKNGNYQTEVSPNFFLENSKKAE